jgi:hypothetical protein
MPDPNRLSTSDYAASANARSTTECMREPKPVLTAPQIPAGLETSFNQGAEWKTPLIVLEEFTEEGRRRI